MNRWQMALVLVNAMTMASCSFGAQPAKLDGRTFLSTGIVVADEPFALVDGTRIRLSFADGQVSAQAGCNTMFGSYRLDGTTLVVDGVGMTEMGCDPDRHAQDEWLGDLLAARPTLTLAGNDLSLTSGDTVVSLLDREVADPDLGLVGPLWTVEEIISGDAVSSTPPGTTATLRFGADGTLEVNFGCNTGGGRYEVDGSTLRIFDLLQTEMACTDERGALEAAVGGVLSAGQLTWQVEASKLTLTAGDKGLGLLGS